MPVTLSIFACAFQSQKMDLKSLEIFMTRLTHPWANLSYASKQKIFHMMSHIFSFIMDNFRLMYLLLYEDLNNLQVDSTKI